MYVYDNWWERIGVNVEVKKWDYYTVWSCGEEEDIWAQLSKDLTNIFWEKITIKEEEDGQIAIASNELSEKVKKKLDEFGKRIYFRINKRKDLTREEKIDKMQRLIDFVRKLKWYRKYKNNEKAQKILWYLEGVLEKYKTRLEFIKIEVSKTYTLPLWNLYELKEDVRWQAYSIYKDGTVKYVWNANITANWWKTYIWINRKSDVKTVVVINWSNKYYLWEVPSKKEISKLNTNLDREKLNVTILKGVKGVKKEKNKENWDKLVMYDRIHKYGINEKEIEQLIREKEESKQLTWTRISSITAWVGIYELFVWSITIWAGALIVVWCVVVVWTIIYYDDVVTLDRVRKIEVESVPKVKVEPDVERRTLPKEEDDECKLIRYMYFIVKLKTKLY